MANIREDCYVVSVPEHTVHRSVLADPPDPESYQPRSENGLNDDEYKQVIVTLVLLASEKRSPSLSAVSLVMMTLFPTFEITFRWLQVMAQAPATLDNTKDANGLRKY